MHVRLRYLPIMLVLACVLLRAPAAAQLDEYLARPEPDFAWTKVAESELGRVRVHRLVVNSQVWRGLPWRHGLSLFVPETVEYPGWALLVVTGGSGAVSEEIAADGDNQLGIAVSQAVSAPVAVLSHVPNQPLFDGLCEDDLISYTFVQYLQSADASWPLLLPMAKSAIKAMDAVQEFAAQELGQPIEQFVVAGASKRGWTTWLTGASGDPRVRALIPIVIDILNLPAQMPHQLAMWGRYSEEINAYTKRGLQQHMGTERGRELVRMVDPYSYRARLALPKLIINGSNDRYWAVDALTLYWDELVGPKAVLYVPNTGHKLEDAETVLGAAAAFFRAIAGGTPFPYPTWQHGERRNMVTLTMSSTPAPGDGRVWFALTDTADFRDSTWQAVPMARQGAVLVGEIAKPQSGRVALFGEADYDLSGRRFSLSTAPRVYPAVGAD